MTKNKKMTLSQVWVPKKTVKPDNQFFYHLTTLDKYSKKIPKKLPVALTLDFGTNIPTHSFNTKRFIPE